RDSARPPEQQFSFRRQVRSVGFLAVSSPDWYAAAEHSAPQPFVHELSDRAVAPEPSWPPTAPWPAAPHWKAGNFSQSSRSNLPQPLFSPPCRKCPPTSKAHDPICC